MRKVLMIMFMTLDGRAQFPVYDEPPYTAEVDDPMWKPRFDSIDTIILGARAYPKWAAHWPKMKDEPHATPWQKEFSRFTDRVTKVVFSKSLSAPLWENTRFARGTVAEEMMRLRSEKGKDIAVGGGPRIAQSLLAEDLIDELLIQMMPSIVERGKPLFHTVDEPDFAEDIIPKGAAGRHDFLLVEAKGQADSVVFLHYAKAK